MIVPGAIVEVVGPPSSGRTSLLVSWLRDVTRRGATAALVDVDHAFDPPAAARAGVDLGRVLWIRCGRRRDLALRATDLLVRCPGLTLVTLDCGEIAPRLPLTTAFRFKQALRRTGGTLIIAARRRLAGPGACLAVETTRQGLEWSGPAGQPRRLARVGTGLRVLRRGAGAPPVGGGGLTWWSA